MAETLVSPGVLARENDSSFVSQQPVAVGAAIIGPTVKGPVEVPTVVTSYSDYSSIFGTTFDSGSDEYSYFTSIAAYNYFQNGGESLLVARVVSGSYTVASATGDQAPSSSATSGSFILETLGKGEILNSSSSLDSSGSLELGTSDNVRWEISNPSTSSGTFDLLIRRGDDNDNNKIVLETFTGLSLDPKADNYISKVVGDQVRAYNVAQNQVTVTGDYRNASRYVRVSSVTNPTLNYFDNNGVAKTSLTPYIPVASSGSFKGAAGAINNVANFYDNIAAQSQGLVGENYTNMINLLANQDDYVFNVLLTPGLTNEDHTAQCTSLINNTQTRGDSIFVLDLTGYDSTVTSVTSEAASRNSSYAASYWPWVQVIDPDLGRQVWVPASTVIGGVYAYNDSVSEPWFAPAGINRGGLS